MLEPREDQSTQECPLQKAHQWLPPKNKGPPQPGSRQAWDRALRQGLARLEQYPDPGGTDFVFG